MLLNSFSKALDDAAGLKNGPPKPFDFNGLGKRYIIDPLFGGGPKAPGP
jgi:hypothetical protein